jgi:hypothetical protein
MIRVMMKCLFLTSALFLACALPLVAKDSSDAQHLLDTAQNSANLFQDTPSPFEIVVDFTAQLNVAQQGRLVVKWQSKDHWWSKVSVGGFEQIRIRNGEQEYTLRNIAFTPVRVRELFTLMHITETVDGFIAMKPKWRNENGNQSACLQARRERNRIAETHEFCVDGATNDLLSDEWKVQPDERRKEQFFNYFDFEGRRYPRSLQLFKDGSRVISASVMSLRSAALDPATLTAPKGAVERRICAGITPPVAIKQPSPEFNNSNGFAADDEVSLTVLADGSVGDIQLIGRGGKTMDDTTVATLKKWKFKPAMCGDEPVVSDIEVTVSVRTN